RKSNFLGMACVGLCKASLVLLRIIPSLETDRVSIHNLIALFTKAFRGSPIHIANSIADEQLTVLCLDITLFKLLVLRVIELSRSTPATNDKERQMISSAEEASSHCSLLPLTYSNRSEAMVVRCFGAKYSAGGQLFASFSRDFWISWRELGSTL
ncbi:hypothetical protein STEG23_022451, partial [Scotinomys teguina]